MSWVGEDWLRTPRRLRVLELLQSASVLGIGSHAIGPDVPLEQVLCLSFEVDRFCLTPEAAFGTHKRGDAHVEAPPATGTRRRSG